MASLLLASSTRRASGSFSLFVQPSTGQLWQHTLVYCCLIVARYATLGLIFVDKPTKQVVRFG